MVAVCTVESSEVYDAKEALIGKLCRLGLTRNEARIYIFIAKGQEFSATEIATAIKLHRTETYRILDSLMRRGLVFQVFKKPLRFTTLSFSEGYDILVHTLRSTTEKIAGEKLDACDLFESVNESVKVSVLPVGFQYLAGAVLLKKLAGMLDGAKASVFIHCDGVLMSLLYYQSFFDGLLGRGLDVSVVCVDSAKCRALAKDVGVPLVFSVDEVQNFVVIDEGEVLAVDAEPCKMAGCKLSGIWFNLASMVQTYSALFNQLKDGCIA